MSERNDNLNANELRDVQRLVDGELDLAAQQRLLRRLESASDGWRHCALAFLESQALTHVLAPPSSPTGKGPLVKEGIVVDAEVQSAASQVRRAIKLPSGFVLAASFFVAFALGLALRGTVLHHSTTGGVDFATPKATSPNTESMAQATAEPAAPTASPATSPSSDAADADTPIRFVGSGDQELSARDRRRSLIPPQVRRALERMGHRVEEHLEMLPIELEDGTQGYVPAERIELHYIGNQYQ